ncbi:hypothetical protein D3C80_2151680 [compost metagenome]
MAPTGAEVTGAQCQFGNAKAGTAAESRVAHGVLLLEADLDVDHNIKKSRLGNSR